MPRGGSPGLQGAGGRHGGDRAAAAGLRTISDFRQRHLTALAGCSCRCSGCAAGRVGEARPCRARRHQDQGQRLQAQGHELRAHVQAEAALAAEVRPGWRRPRPTDARSDAELRREDRRGDELPDWIADKAARLAQIRVAKAPLEAGRAAKPRPRQTAAAEPAAQPRGGRHRRPRRARPSEGPAQLHRPRQPDHDGQGRLHPGLQRAGRGGCAPTRSSSHMA